MFMVDVFDMHEHGLRTLVMCTDLTSATMSGGVVASR